jgi:hypothetical protein
MYRDIIAIANPKHLARCYKKYGIPAVFWLARKEAFPVGTPPTLIYKDKYRGLIAVEICENLEHPEQDNDALLFKLVYRTISKLKDELLKIWEGAEIDYHSLHCHFLDIEYMATEQRERLRTLNARLAIFEKQLRKQYDWAKATYPGHCHWANIYFQLAESDPDYTDNDDNIIVTLNDEVVSPEFDDVNWNKDPRILDENGKPEHHCNLYHELYEHSGLLWEDLLRIEKICVQFRVNFDLDFELFAKKAELTGLIDC